MNYFDLYSSYPDSTIAAAWDSQVKEADETPWLTDSLTECGEELFARFATCYAELRALPRSARRAVQRQLCTFQRAGCDPTGIFTAGRETTTAQDGLVVGRRRFAARARTGSGEPRPRSPSPQTILGS